MEALDRRRSITDAEADKMLYDDQLQEIPWVGAGRGFPAKFRRCTLPWGKAVLFLTPGYAQGMTGGVVSNESLTLVVQGFTNDGRYAVNCHLVIHHPSLPDSLLDKSQSGKVEFDFDNDDEKAAQWLDSQPDDSFQPTFLQYQTFLQSLQITGSTKS
jgi:hypothetical protein